MKKLVKDTLLLLSIASSVFVISSCQTGPKSSTDNSDTDSPLFNVNPKSGNLKHIILVGTNDIHGAIEPLDLKTKEGTAYQRGGLAAFSGYLSILRKRFGSQALWLDAGDEFQGTLESNSEEGAPMVALFNAMHLDAAVIGNHEFDYGPVGFEPTKEGDDLRGALKARLSEAKYPYLSSNMRLKKSHLSPEMPNLHPSVILNAGDIKVGVIGLTTEQTPYTTIPANVKDLEFEDLAETSVKEAASLRKQGAQIIVALAHAGLFCKSQETPLSRRIRTIKDSFGPCGETDEIVALLRHVPRGTFDAIVSGHTHSYIAQWIEGVPVIQAGTQGQSFNIIDLPFNTDTGKVETERTLIEGPVSICQNVFEKLGHCDGQVAVSDKGKWKSDTAAKFLGQKIVADETVVKLIDQVRAKTQAIKGRVIGEAPAKISHARPCTDQTALGSITTDYIREETKADVALMNCGGIRSNFEEGPIHYGDLFRVFPFDNSIVVLDVTGSELQTILRVAENGSKGYFQVSGAKLKLRPLNAEAPSKDLDRNGKIDAWEFDRLLGVEIKTDSGYKKLNPNGKYRLALPDFLYAGGDSFEWAMKQIHKSQLENRDFGQVRDIMERQILKLKIIKAPDDVRFEFGSK